MFRRQRKIIEEGGRVAGFTVDVDAPADVVWGLVVDLESYPRLFAELDQVENLTPRKGPLTPISPGVRFRKIGRFADGSNFSVDITCTIVDPAKRVFGCSTIVWNCTQNQTTTVVQVEDEKCRLSVVYSMIPDGWRGKFFLRWFGRQREQRKDMVLSNLQVIKSIAENGGIKKGP